MVTAVQVVSFSFKRRQHFCTTSSINSKDFFVCLCIVDHCKDKVWQVEVDDVISFWWTSYGWNEKKYSNAITIYYSWALTLMLIITDNVHAYIYPYLILSFLTLRSYDYILCSFINKWQKNIICNYFNINFLYDTCHSPPLQFVLNRTIKM